MPLACSFLFLFIFSTFRYVNSQEFVKRKFVISMVLQFVEYKGKTECEGAICMMVLEAQYALMVCFICDFVSEAEMIYLLILVNRNSYLTLHFVLNLGNSYTFLMCHVWTLKKSLSYTASHFCCFKTEA